MSLFFSRSFGGYFWTQFLGAFNDNVFKQSLVFMTSFQLAHALAKDWADFYVSLGAGLFILPFVLFSTYGAAWADQWGKARVIRATKILEIVIMSLAVLGYWFLDVSHPQAGLWFLLGVLFLMGSQSALFGPSKYGILPEILHEDQLTPGNGLLELGTFVGILLGTYLGGWLVDWFGLQPIWMTAFFVTFAVIGYGTSRLIPETPIPQGGATWDWWFPRQIAKDWRHMMAQGSLKVSILSISFFWFAGAVYLQILPGFGVELGATPRQTNFLMILFSIGIGLGSMTCVPLSRFHVDLSLILPGLAGMALFSLDLGLFAPSQVNGWLDLWRIFLDLFFIGFFGGLFVVPLNAHLQRVTVPSDRARMMGLTNILNALFMVGSTVMTLALRSLAGWGEPQLIAFLGLLMLGYGLVVVAWQPYWLPLSWYRLKSWLGQGPELSSLPPGPKLVIAGAELGFWPQMMVDEPMRYLGAAQPWWAKCQPQGNASSTQWTNQGDPELITQALAQGRTIWLLRLTEEGGIFAQTLEG